MDGLKWPIQQASNTEQQALFYNDWKNGHLATAVMCFFSDATISLNSLMFPELSTTTQFANWEGYMTNWNKFTMKLVEFVLWIQLPK